MSARGFSFTRWITFLGTIHWECRTWLDMVHATRREYTTGPARFPQWQPTRPTLVVKLDLGITLAQIPTQMCWLGPWWVGPPITQIPSLIPGLSFSSLSPLHISMPRWWAFSLSFQLTIDFATVSIYDFHVVRKIGHPALLLRGKKMETSVANSSILVCGGFLFVSEVIVQFLYTIVFYVTGQVYI